MGPDGLLRLRDRTGRQSGLASAEIPAKEAYVSVWLIILIIVIVVLLLAGLATAVAKRNQMLSRPSDSIAPDHLFRGGKWGRALAGT